MIYSQRYGHSPIKILKVDEISAELKNGIIDGLEAYFLTDIYGIHRDRKSNSFINLCRILWHHSFKLPTAYIPESAHDAKQSILKKVYDSSFPKFYDYIEFFANIDEFDSIDDSAETADLFRAWCNRIFEREHAPIRFVSGVLVELTNENEIKEIELAANSDINAVSTHIQSAIEKFSNRTAPDYRNSIKEAISAVEAASRIVTGNANATLGDALTAIEKSGKLHGSLKRGFTALYGWTSDAGGIRHALLDKETITESDARFMLVACGAFSNYLLASSKPISDQ
jgi:AbiJ N-terminal domain 4